MRGYERDKRLGQEGVSMARYAMAFDYKLCINCHACEVACKEENGILLGADHHRLWIDVTEPTGSFFDLQRNKNSFMPMQCQECEVAFCEIACPTDAIWYDKNGIVRTDADKCILCEYCMKACPYDARYINENRKFADKCIFCADTRLARGETTTACQITCPAKVRIFGDLDDPGSDISHALKSRSFFTIKSELGTKPKLFYLE